MFRYRQHDGASRAHIEGEMTIYNAAALKESLAGILADPLPLELDLSGVTELDSAGVQLLIMAKKERARSGLPLTLVSHSEAVLDSFELMGLVDYFGGPGRPHAGAGSKP